ncbi:hypothetical protein DYB28_014723 [Aphanomyces astaci]|uniref:Uncharacterized protein n=1 Tax=Aphanomyces astaci TaxID=112090 RepID=A0A397CGY3_APHAT|nr:hypothetical protein DYB30_002670 [Aphanomyces astaci]RLO01776.1 hypothetical protein DYB28_014723 [Aphanomyces astaci]
MASHASSGTRIEERERRVYKDAHAAQFVKIRHFPALSQVTSSGDNIILLQDAMDNADTNAHRSTRQSLRMERIQSRVGDADASVFNAGSASEAKSRIARPKDYDYPTGIHCREDRVLSPAQQALVVGR